MFNIQYHRTYRMICNQHRLRLMASRKGKKQDSCSMAPVGNKTILVAIPYQMNIIDAGSRIERLSRLWSDYTLVPVSMPRVAA